MLDNSYDILTVPELMEILQVGQNYAYYLLHTNKIKGYRVGRSWRIPRKSVENYIDAQINQDNRK